MDEPADLDALWPSRPWEAVTDDALAPALAVPSMLSLDEARLYHWLGARARGAGATVDLGAFAGGSAARLLSGLALSGRPYHLHAYDRFEAKPATRAKHLPGAPTAAEGETDILPLARAHLAPWAPHVTLHRGDIGRQVWSGAPLEILAIDAGKTPALTDHIAAEFFPCLVPGVSVVIHQDFLHATQPWLVLQMLRLSHRFRLHGTVAKDAAVFTPLALPTPDDLAAARTEGLDDDALIAGLREAAKRWSGLIPRHRFRTMIERLKANPGVRVAWQMWRGKAGRT